MPPVATNANPHHAVIYFGTMKPTEDLDILRAVARCSARSLLIGRRALIALGLPVLTADYDFWIHIDDAEQFNAALAPLDFLPTRTPAEARQFGRYVLENSERADVLVARAVGTIDGRRIAFDDIWPRRQRIALSSSEFFHIPHIDDLIATKQFASRAKDAEDIRLLESLKSKAAP